MQLWTPSKTVNLKNILLTGASGFVGQNYQQKSVNMDQVTTLSLRQKAVDDISWTGIDTVLHFAGLAHQMDGAPDENYFAINFELTKKLAIAAKKNEVKQFLFLSTIKVYGECSDGAIYTETSPCIPTDAYGQSKLDAEDYLRSIASDSFVVTIVRPPLIFGPGVKGNLDKIIKLCDSGWWLPLGSIYNERTMVSVTNLIHFLDKLCGEKRDGTFVISEKDYVSTTNLVTYIRAALGRKKRVFSLPTPFRHVIRKLKPSFYIRLFGSLRIDSSASVQSCNFEHTASIESAIKEMINAYKHK